MTMAGRNCKVIATGFGRRGRRAVLDLLALTREVERATDPGAPCDTIIVNNDAGWSPGNRYLAAIDGTPTFAGTLKVLNRDDYGRAQGAFDAAFQAFRGQYDYWTFTEDTTLINAPGYLARAIDVFTSQPRAGFVAMAGLTDVAARHAQKSVGLTHAAVLDAVSQAWGCLPHQRRHEAQDDEEMFDWCEVVFTHVIGRMGYQLIDAGGPTATVDLSPAQRAVVQRVVDHRAYVPRLRRFLEETARLVEEWAYR